MKKLKANIIKRNKKGQIIKTSVDRIYKVNDQIFSDTTVDNSYWAGFIAGDGNIYQPKTGQLKLQVGLDKKDLLHLKKLKTFIESNYKLYKDRECYKLIIRSDQLCKDLKKNFSITQKKSFTLKKPKNLNKKETLSFIKGVIDSDGYVKKASSKNCSCIITSSSLSFIKWIKKFIENNFHKKINLISRKDKVSYCIFIYGNYILKEIKESSKFGLKRKWQFVF